MSYRVKLFSLLGGALAIVIFFAFIISRGDNAVKNVEPISTGKLPVATEPFSNAFVNQNGTPTIPKNNDENKTSLNLVSVPDPYAPDPIVSAPSPSGTETGDTFITFEDLENLVSTFSPIVVPEKKKIKLPEVLDSELTIAEGGASDFGTYMDVFIDKATNITFSYEKYDKILKNEAGIPLAPESLVEKAILDDDFSQIQESVAITKEFLEYKIGVMKGVAVKDAAVDINKLVIGFDKLTVELMDKAIEVYEGKLARANFVDYFAEYNNTAIFYNQELNQKYGVASLFYEKKGVSVKLAELFGLGKVARAFLPLPFGGVIGTITPCVCSLGALITVGPPVGGTFFISFFYSRIFAFFKPLARSWILGDYTAVSLLCLQPGTPCVSAGRAQGVVIIAGTSL